MTTDHRKREARDLQELLRTVTASIAAEGPDSQQVAIDLLVWAYASQMASEAMKQWSREVPDPAIRALAEATSREARTHIRGCSWSERVDMNLQLAELALDEPLEDMGATDEHKLLRASLREFSDREIRPLATRIHREDLDVPESIIQEVARFGLFGVSIPVSLGGTQDRADSRAMLIATEELSRASLAAGGSLITRPEILIRALIRGGTEEQQQRWLPKIASGEQLVAVAVTEPDYGSNVADITCRARRLASGDWEFNGTKSWCTFAGRAELLMILARTGGPGYRGLSAFAIEKPAFHGREFEHLQAAGGRLVGRAIPTLGYRGLHTFELSFEGFRAPFDSLIGGDEWLDRGFYLQLDGFSQGRLQTAGRAVGVMQAAFEDAHQYAKQRVVFGQPIGANQLARSKLGAMALRLHSSRRLSYAAADLVDAGSGQTEASLAKLYSSRAAEIVTRDAAQLHGAMGYSEEVNASRYFVDARVLPVFEGAEEVLSLRVIGKSLLNRA